jgi:hypothetical protein
MLLLLLFLHDYIMQDNNVLDVIPAAGILSLLTTTLTILDSDDSSVEENQNKDEHVQIHVDALQSYKQVKRRINLHENENNTTKYKRYDYVRAQQFIYQDYLGDEPLFGEQFERVFRISKQIFFQILDVCHDNDPFFTKRNLLNSEIGICPEAKLLIALKQCAFGVSPSAFLDYFQMGETTARTSLKKICKIITSFSIS